MSDIQTGDILRITAKMSYEGNAVQNVYHMQYTYPNSRIPELMWSNIAETLETAMTWLLDFVNGDMTFDTIEVWNVTQDEPVWEDSWPSLTTFSGTGDTLPLQMAPLVLFNTNTARSQGRKYLPPIEEGKSQPGGELSSTTLTAVANYAAEILDGVYNSALQVVGLFGNWSETYDRFAPWISAAVDLYQAVQRRRRVGTGI